MSSFLKPFKLLFIFAVIIFHAHSLEAETGLRIISISPAATEIIYSLGAGESLIAVSSFCDWPPEVKQKKKIGSFSSPNIEKIIFLNPDIVITTGLEQVLVVQQLKALKIKIVRCFPSSIEKLFGSIKEIGRAIDRQEEADKLVRDMTLKIKEVAARFEDVPLEKRPKVLLELWGEPLLVAGKDSIVGQLIELAGGRNIAYDAVRPYSLFSYELVLERNPDYIVSAYMNKADVENRLVSRLGYKYLKAAKNNHIIYDIDSDIILRPGPRITEAIDKINKRIYGK